MPGCQFSQFARWQNCSCRGSLDACLPFAQSQVSYARVSFALFSAEPPFSAVKIIIPISKKQRQHAFRLRVLREILTKIISHSVVVACNKFGTIQYSFIAS